MDTPNDAPMVSWALPITLLSSRSEATIALNEEPLNSVLRVTAAEMRSSFPIDSAAPTGPMAGVS